MEDLHGGSTLTLLSLWAVDLKSFVIVFMDKIRTDYQ